MHFLLAVNFINVAINSDNVQQDASEQERRTESSEGIGRGGEEHGGGMAR